MPVRFQPQTAHRTPSGPVSESPSRASASHSAERVDGRSEDSRSQARTRIALPKSIEELPKWFEGRRTVSDVTIPVEQLPELVKLLSKGELPRREGDRTLVPAMVMDLDKTIRDGTLTTDVAKSVLFQNAPSVRAVQGGVAQGRQPPPAAVEGASSHWVVQALRKLLTGLVVASSPAAFTGHTEEEVGAATRALVGASGAGKVYDGMREVVRAADKSGLKSFVVTAGLEAPARVVAEAVGVPRDRVRGVRPVKTPSGKILPLPKLPLPFASGKSKAMSKVFEQNGIPPQADPVLVLGDNPLVTDSGLVRRGWVDAIVEPDARTQSYIKDALARGQFVFAVDVHRRLDGSPVKRFQGAQT